MEISDGETWPMFRYSKPEQARFKSITDQLPGKAMWVFLAVTVVVFLVVAALAVVLILLPILTLIAPNPADLTPLPFVLAMALAGRLLVDAAEAELKASRRLPEARPRR